MSSTFLDRDSFESPYFLYFDIGWTICEKTMCPIAQFTCKKTKQVFSFRVSCVDIEDYKANVSYPKSIKEIDDFVKKYKRDIDLGEILK